jgi:hypothetical protein
MVRRGSVGSASACRKAGPSSILGSVFPTELTSDEMERGPCEWRRINVLNVIEWIFVCDKVLKRINLKTVSAETDQIYAIPIKNGERPLRLATDKCIECD